MSSFFVHLLYEWFACISFHIEYSVSSDLSAMAQGNP